MLKEETERKLVRKVGSEVGSESVSQQVRLAGPAIKAAAPSPRPPILCLLTPFPDRDTPTQHASGSDCRFAHH
jgi:hypothetical protein